MASRTARTLIQPTAESNTEDLTLTSHVIPTPNLTKNEHLIQVHACSPCAGELHWPRNFPPPQPRDLIPCPDVSGTVVSAPPDSPFQPGAEVYARTNYIRPGNARDYTIATTDELALKPRGLSWVEAAAVPVSAETAWQILFIHAGVVSPDAEMDRILVTAASGGFGMWVVQVAARVLGVEVVGTCGSDNVELVRSMGAKEVVDYRATDLKVWVEQETGKRVDVVIDCVGGRALQDAWWAVKQGGTVLSIVQPPEGVCPRSEKGGVKDIFFVMQPSGKQLGMITELIEEGKCRGLVDSVWPLERFRPAFERLDTGHTCGKIVLDLALNQ
ncbi:NAD(P)-binding protein [Aspergillus sclerotioniger CBS 115572]|uniref:NAD(P)-binding protein n=1 Tax=Aspergillus sclerotioniger CBS 115572 TaxID=1450535 RepID=A0A317VWP5_9EURO|nr:NAD(P)-binding protein [Aspergillus sclerotioniger CBS 115572]PWY78009.1 NAD(P)-binding protein [Aspergillus sclerotioniger CBS 115572]